MYHSIAHVEMSFKVANRICKSGAIQASSRENWIGSKDTCLVCSIHANGLLAYNC